MDSCNKQESQSRITLKHEQNNTVNEIECNQYPISSIKQPQVVFVPRRYGVRRGPLIDYIEKKQFSRQFKPKGRGKR